MNSDIPSILDDYEATIDEDQMVAVIQSLSDVLVKSEVSNNTALRALATLVAHTLCSLGAVDDMTAEPHEAMSGLMRFSADLHHALAYAYWPHIEGEELPSEVRQTQH